MNDILLPKSIECKCGNTIEIDRPKVWCQQCCQPNFYHDKDKRLERLNHYYMVGAIAFAIMLMTYFFIEVVAVPLFG
jgi:hypothetical protein